MNAIKITIAGYSFLLPETHDNYLFPDYIQEHRDAIVAAIKAAEQWKKNPLDNAPFHNLTDLSTFKKRTGIIGWPLNIHDVDLYILDRCVNVIFEMTL